MKTVQKISLAFAVLFLVVLCFCAGCVPQQKFQRSVELSNPVGSCEIIDAKTSNGSIKCSGIETQEFKVIAKITGKASKIEDAQRLAEETNVSIEQIENKMLVKIDKPKKGSNENICVSLDITGPKNLSVAFRTSNGNIKVNNIAGNMSAQTSNGNITGCDIGGDVNGSSSNGNIKFERVAKNVTGSTSNGNINAYELKGNCQCKTSNGSIKMVYSDCAPQASNIVAGTSNGSIHLKAPKWNAGEVEVSVGNGHIHSDSFLQFSGKIRGTAKWKIGGDSNNKLKLSTSNGSIEIY